MAVLSIQSSVAFGHVGNSAAVFALQRLGREVRAVHTTQLSNHTGLPGWGGGPLGAAHLRGVFDGLERSGGFAGLDAALTGYIGDADSVAAAARAIDRARAARPGLVYCCDPVAGNARRGLYVSEETAEAVAKLLVPRADIATPNAFELARLSGRPAAGAAEALDACRALSRRGPRTVVATSLETEGGVGALARSPDGAWLVETPRLPAAGNGAGDLAAALLLDRLLAGAPLAAALSRAVSAVWGLLEAAGGGEIPLAAAQERLVDPPRVFPARQVAGPDGA